MKNTLGDLNNHLFAEIESECKTVKKLFSKQ